MKKKVQKRRKGGTIDRNKSFDEFLAKDDLLAETEDAAIKEIIADQIKVAMDKKGLSKTAKASG
jgi:antitoxin HicB